MGVKDLTIDRVDLPPVRSGKKWLEVLYNDEDKIRIGETLRLLDPDGECFALANVEGTFHMTAEEFMNSGFPYWRDMDLQRFLEIQNEYYDDPITRRTELKIISFQITTRIEDYEMNQTNLGEFNREEE